MEGLFLTLADFEELLSQFPPGMSLSEIREEARIIQSKSLKQMLSSGQALPLDRPTTLVEEIELDPGSPPGGRVVDAYAVLGELTSRLRENGYELSDETERRKIAHAVLTAKAVAFHDIERRKKGEAIETPPRPASMAVNKGPETFPTLLKLHDDWVDLVKPDRKTKDDNKLYVERFVSMHGNLRVDQIKRKQVREFRDQLKKFPAAIPAHISKKPFLEIVAWAEKNDSARLSPFTINMKGLGALSTLLRLAINEYDLEGGDPTSGLRLPVADDDVLDRHPFTPALLAKMPLSPVFQESPKVSIGGCGAAAFWIRNIRFIGIESLLLTDHIAVAGFRREDVGAWRPAGAAALSADRGWALFTL